MRPRKRSDWPVRVFRFWASPREPMPPVVWSTARQMLTTWNALVEARERVAQDAQHERACFCGDDHRPRVKARWARWNDEARAIAKHSSLNWEQGPAVLDRFTTACIAAARGQRGWPQIQHRLDRIMIPHRFTGGGIPVAALYSSRAQRVRLVAPSPRAYEPGLSHSEKRRLRVSPAHRDGPHPDHEMNRFWVGDAAIEFRAVYHRPLPETAIVKQVAWTGRRHVTRGWQWALTITVEEPPRPVGVTTGTSCSRAAGLDLGWRVMGDGAYLRIGMLVDGASGQAIELRLPLDAPTSHTRRHRLKSGWRDLAGMDEALARLLDATKAAVRPRLWGDDLPAEVAGIVRGWERVRQGGLIRLLRALESTPEQRVEPRVTVLRAWRQENDRLRSLRMELWDRLIGRRQWYYHNLAAWMCATWSTIAWEGDLRLKAMAEDDDVRIAPGDLATLAEHAGDGIERDLTLLRQNQFALRRSMRYRHIAALSEFRLALRHAAARAGTTLVDKPAAYTTLTCAVCDDVLAGQDGSLWLECKNGHRHDQDENAARNLLAQIGPRGVGRGTKDPETPIPLQLRGVAVHAE